MGIVVAGKSFRSKEELKLYTRRVLISNFNMPPVCCYDPDFPFLSSLVARHPNAAEKIGCGIYCFYIGRNESNGGPTLDILRSDGSKIDISWRACVTGLDTTYWSNLSAAMRTAISRQISEIRNKIILPYTCPSCSSILSWIEEIEVHHMIPFSVIQKEFLQSHLGAPKQFDDGPRNAPKFKNEDKNFEEDWFRFHKERAALTAVCELCHIRMTQANPRAEKAVTG